MFKVQENGDGSTSIFCKSTGELICKIQSQQRNMGLGCRPVNVVEPTPQSRKRSHFYHIDSNSCSSDEDHRSTRKVGSISPLPDELKEDFDYERIDHEIFARCLNLVPTKKFQDTPLDQLNSTFPLRHHSRTKSIQLSKDMHDVKFPDDLPLTSSLGVKLLKLHPQKNFPLDQIISQKIKNYDSFCRFQLNTPTACSNFPKLRCREKKEYPVYLSHKFTKSGPTHTYAFNKRQRLEKMLTFKTGLSTRSRKLLKQCSKRLAVRLKILSTDEIQVWLSKKSGIVRPITLDSIQEEAILICSDSETTVVDNFATKTCTSADSRSPDSSTSSSSSSDSDYAPVNASVPNKIVSFKGVLSNSGLYLSPIKSDKYLSPTKSEKYLSPTKSHCLSPSNSTKYFSTPIRNRNNSRIFRHGSIEYSDCYVKMNNILKRVCKYLDEYYVRGTPIRIPFLSEYLNSLNPKAFDMRLVLDIDAHLNPSSSRILNANIVSNSRNDHAYHLPFPNKTLVKSKPLCLNSHKSSIIKDNSKQLLRESNNPKTKPNILSKLSSIQQSPKPPVDNTLRVIPVIDLTNESPPKKQIKRWIFQCYGCGFKKVFTEEYGFKTSGIEHLKKYHCVSEPESFLSSRCTTSGFVMEAFPGYKESRK